MSLFVDDIILDFSHVFLLKYQILGSPKDKIFWKIISLCIKIFWTVETSNSLMEISSLFDCACTVLSSKVLAWYILWNNCQLKLKTSNCLFNIILSSPKLCLKNVSIPASIVKYVSQFMHLHFHWNSKKGTEKMSPLKRFDIWHTFLISPY